MCVSILGSRSFSCVLAAGHSRIIGRQFLPMVLSMPGFRIGMIIALCHISCICPVRIDRLKALWRVEKVQKFWLSTASVGDPAARRQIPFGQQGIRCRLQHDVPSPLS